MKLLIMYFSPPPIISALFGPNTVLTTLFLSTLDPYSSLSARHQVSHPYKVTSNQIGIMVHDSEPNGINHSRNFIGS
jgi:hypothetical protein